MRRARAPPRGCTRVKCCVQDSCLAKGPSAAPVMTSSTLWRQLEHYKDDAQRDVVVAMYEAEDAELET